MRIWVTRPKSPSTFGTPPPISLTNLTPRLSNGETIAATSSIALLTSTSSCRTTNVLRLEEAASRMSLTRRFKRCPELRIILRFFLTVAGHLASFMSASVSPIMPLRGVRSSWVTEATRASCASCAAWRSAWTFLSSLMSYSLTNKQSLPVSEFLAGTMTSLCQTMPPVRPAEAESARFGTLRHSNWNGSDCKVKDRISSSILLRSALL
mmetsp:Transcript_3336/g.7870  ORF Transcript_3336/g.7870 Transcript_3336/m.7870 type:complete len:209 (-) Transcript_3336:643-1269(-)